MNHSVHVFAYLAEPGKTPSAPVCVLFGDESFLSQLALQALRDHVLGKGADVPYATLDGERCIWRDVDEELASQSLFGGGAKRFVVVEQADEFVSKFRGELEMYAAKPRASAVLTLLVSTWPANTRLYKIVQESGLTIECRAPEKSVGKNKVPDDAATTRWLASWSRQRHQAQLTLDAAALLLEAVGPQFGLLDQELARLALFAGLGGKITPELVREHAGGWRLQTTWELIDLIADGRAAEAIDLLDRLLRSGDHPLALFGPLTWSLRRFAVATRIYERAESHGARISLAAALEQAGFRNWPQGAMQRSEKQLKNLSRARAAKLFHWLLQVDLALKGSHSSEARARFALEQIIVRLSQSHSPAHASSP